jgi:hypothetical protein
MRQTRPFVLWQELLNRVLEEYWHPTIKDTFTSQATMSFMGLYHFSTTLALNDQERPHLAGNNITPGPLSLLDEHWHPTIKSALTLQVTFSPPLQHLALQHLALQPPLATSIVETRKAV